MKMSGIVWGIIFFVIFILGISTINYVFAEPIVEKDPVNLTEGIITGVEIENVVDGDTVDVVITKRVRIRLIDCWAPESRTKDQEEKARGLAAKKYLFELLKSVDNKAILAVPMSDTLMQSFTLNRVLGLLYIKLNNEIKSVSDIMVMEGHATPTKVK